MLAIIAGLLRGLVLLLRTNWMSWTAQFGIMYLFLRFSHVLMNFGFSKLADVQTEMGKMSSPGTPVDFPNDYIGLIACFIPLDAIAQVMTLCMGAVGLAFGIKFKLWVFKLGQTRNAGMTRFGPHS